ncbi:MAG TPA: glycosyltransferase [Humisphaera sp.]
MVGPSARRHPARVAFVNHTATLGGGEIALYHLVTRLDRGQFDPVVILLADGPLRPRLESAGVAVRVVRGPSSVLDARKDAIGGRAFHLVRQAAGTLLLAWRLAAEIRRCQPALVHTNSLKSDVIGGVAARLAGVPLIWHVRDRIAEDYLPARVVKAFRVLARKVPDLVVTNSEATRQTLLVGASADGAFAARVHVAHDGTVPPPEPPARPRGGPPLVGLVGRIAPWKGQDVFIRAAAQVRQARPDVRFLVIGAALFGETAYEQEVRAMARDLGLGAELEFTGFRTDVPDLIAKLDVLVHASVTGEPFGQVIIEGMAAGRPVVATAGGGVPEVVDDGATGILVPMGDAAAMAGAIRRLLDDPAAAEAMGRRARARILQQFTVDHAARRVEAALAACLANHRAAH